METRIGGRPRRPARALRYEPRPASGPHGCRVAVAVQVERVHRRWLDLHRRRCLAHRPRVSSRGSSPSRGGQESWLTGVSSDVLDPGVSVTVGDGSELG
jgi:hypothetical protein